MKEMTTLAEQNNYKLVWVKLEDRYFYYLKHIKDDGDVYNWVDYRMDIDQERLFIKQDLKCCKCRIKVKYEEVENLHKTVMMLKR